MSSHKLKCLLMLEKWLKWETSTELNCAFTEVNITEIFACAVRGYVVRADNQIQRFKV